MQDQPVTLDFVSLERHFLVIFQSALAARIGPNLERFGTRLDPTLVDLVEKGRQHTAVATRKFRRDMPDPIPVVVLGRLTVQALSDDARQFCQKFVPGNCCQLLARCRILCKTPSL